MVMMARAGAHRVADATVGLEDGLDLGVEVEVLRPKSPCLRPYFNIGNGY